MARAVWVRQLELELSSVPGYLGFQRTPFADWEYEATFVLGRNKDGERVLLIVTILLGQSSISVIHDKSVKEEVDRIEGLLKAERAKMACADW